MTIGIILKVCIAIAITLLKSPEAWAQKSSKTTKPTVVTTKAGKIGKAKASKTASPTETPTASPSVSQVPTVCVDTPNWVDKDGDGCDWYEENDLPGCPNNGSSWEGNMGTADDNCCYCFGTAYPTAFPTYYPVMNQVFSY
jgi:hypothetical protein